MNNVLDLKKSFYLKIQDKTDDDITYLQDLNIIKILKEKNLSFKLDFNLISEKDYKKILKRLLRFKRFSKIFKIKIGINENNSDNKIKLGYLAHYNNTSKQNEFILGLNAILCNSKFEMYNYIYDTVCSYLDNQFYGKNLCDFKNNKCGEKRNTKSTWGCCRHFRIKYLGPFTKLVICEHLQKDYTCGAKCISCKLYTCDYLRKKGVKFKIKDILLLNTFFNPLQKYFIKYMLFTPKEKIIKRLTKL